MKKKFLLVLAICGLSTGLMAQDPGDDYAFKSDIILLRFDPFARTVVTDPNNIYQARRGHIFTIRSRETAAGGVAGFCIVFWNFNENAQQVTPASYAVAAGVNYHIIDKTDNGISYFISEAELGSMATTDFRKPRGALKIDALVLPIKLRFKNDEPGGEFDFLQSVSVGPAISLFRGYGGPFSKKSTAFLLGFNVTNISVDDKTAPGVIDSKTTLVGLSPFLGFNIEYQGINFSLLTGIDILTGKAGEVWSYRKSPWLGISIGGSIFAPSKEKQ